MVYYSFKKIRLSLVYKAIAVFFALGFCQLMEAQCRTKQTDYTEIVEAMYNRLIADSLLASSDTFYIIPNDSCIKIKSSKKISSRYPQLVKGESTQLWNNDWLKSKLIEDFPQDSVVDRKVLKSVGSIITFRETRAYMDASNEFVKANEIKTI